MISYVQTHENLAKERDSLKALQMELSLDEAQSNQWVNDVQDWAHCGMLFCVLTLCI